MIAPVIIDNHRRLHRPILNTAGIKLQTSTTMTPTITPPRLIHLIRNMELAMRPDLQRLLAIDMLPRLGAIDGRAVQTTGILILGAVVGRVREEGLQVEKAAEERPGLRDVGDDDGGGGLADVPVELFDAVGLGDGVVL